MVPIASKKFVNSSVKTIITIATRLTLLRVEASTAPIS